MFANNLLTTSGTERFSFPTIKNDPFFPFISLSLSLSLCLWLSLFSSIFEHNFPFEIQRMLCRNKEWVSLKFFEKGVKMCYPLTICVTLALFCLQAMVIGEVKSGLNVWLCSSKMVWLKCHSLTNIVTPFEEMNVSLT